MAVAKKTIKRRKTRSTPAKRKMRRKPRGLSAGFNRANLMDAIKQMMAAGAGGIAAPYANRAFSTIQNKWVRILVVGGGGAIAAHMTGFKALGNGFFGGILALNTQNGLLSDSQETEFADENVLAETPIFLDEETGRPVKMLEDGSTEFLNDEEMQELAELYEENEM